MKRRAFMCACLVTLALPAVAAAQNEGSKPPFYEADDVKDQGDTAFSGNITSSTFYFTESGGDPSQAAPGELQLPHNASPTDRLFTELRLKLRADHVQGKKLDFRADLRFRKQIERCEPRIVGNAGQEVPLTDCLPAQSGLLGGDERDVREVYLRYQTGVYGFNLGRQFMTEIAAIKFDGLRIEKANPGTWKYVAFAGLYPQRGSRDVRTDYPLYRLDPADPMSEKSRVLPFVGGIGASYRKPKLYGSIGAAGIMPQGEEYATGLVEPTRILVSSNGYWQQSDKTDIYHYVVIDLDGVAGAGISNVSIGANHRPLTSVNVFARLNRVDTETLNVHAQQRLDILDVDPGSAARIQNNWYVSRVAQESGELGASAAFKQNRFQLTASGELRRRPKITVKPVGPGQAEVVLPLAQALDIHLQVVDRRSFAKFRIGGSVTRTLARGKENLDRAKSTIARIDASRDFKDGKGEFELNLEYMRSDDQNQVDTCPPGQVDFLQCYGTAQAETIGAGGVVFYRPKKNWYAMGMASVATQTLTTSNLMEEKASQPAVLMITAFARLAYRF